MTFFTNQSTDQSADQSAGKISDTDFFQNYWRKQPYLFRGACLSSLELLVSCTGKHDLLQLASNHLVESRMVSTDYELSLGPFSLETIPENNLLMIQGLEQHLGEINQLLLDEFSFLPRWRIEDVMATIGNSGANCGAHFDHYDVFLVQVKGSKNWQLDRGGHRETHLDHKADIRLLKEFEPVTRELAEAGDVLYIPPGIGHWGIAVDDSITLSVGIRNPTLPELVSHLADMLIDSTNLTSTLDDGLQSPAGGITNVDIQNLQAKLAESILDPELIAHWYGIYMTEPREPELIANGNSLTPGEISVLVSRQVLITCTLPTRMTYLENDEQLKVFVNGDVICSTPAVLPWLQPLCAQRQISGSQIGQGDDHINLLHSLFNNGAIEIVDLEIADKP